MPKEYDELSEEAQAYARRLLKRDAGYLQTSAGWEKECAEGGIVDVLTALGFKDAAYRFGGICGEYAYHKATEVKEALDNCPYANEEIYKIWKQIIAVQRRHLFELSADMRSGDVKNVYRGNRYEDVSDFEDVLTDLDRECHSIIQKSIEWIYSDEYLADELRANVPGGFNDDGTEADPFGIYHANGGRVGEMNEDVDPYRRRFNRIG